jgi:hypothetical protein
MTVTQHGPPWEASPPSTRPCRVVSCRVASCPPLRCPRGTARSSPKERNREETASARPFIVSQPPLLDGIRRHSAMGEPAFRRAGCGWLFRRRSSGALCTCSTSVAPRTAHRPSRRQTISQGPAALTARARNPSALYRVRKKSGGISVERGCGANPPDASTPRGDHEGSARSFAIDGRAASSPRRAAPHRTSLRSTVLLRTRLPALAALPSAPDRLAAAFVGSPSRFDLYLYWFMCGYL